MTDDDLDLILGGEPEIVPRPAFTASVMKAVHEVAALPPPIPFPWKRALPGLAAGGVGLSLAVAMASASSGSSTAQLERWLSALVTLLRSAAADGAGWVVVALALTYLSWRLSTRLARPAFPGR